MITETYIKQEALSILEIYFPLEARIDSLARALELIFSKLEGSLTLTAEEVELRDQLRAVRAWTSQVREECEQYVARLKNGENLEPGDIVFPPFPG